MPKNVSPDLTSEPAILYENGNTLSHYIDRCADFIFKSSKQEALHTGKSVEPMYLFDLAHLCVRKADSSSDFAMKYVDAALTVILQRSSNGQITDTICVQIRQYGKRRPKPSFIGGMPSQY